MSSELWEGDGGIKALLFFDSFTRVFVRCETVLLSLDIPNKMLLFLFVLSWLEAVAAF